jgi:ABC-type nitrate/sulfonate/bicarbonate transport system substrate-binding protein
MIQLPTGRSNAVLPTHDRAAAAPLSARLRYALSAAGLAPDAVDTIVQSSPHEIHVRILREDGDDVTLEQLVTITTVLRAGQWDGPVITAGAA